MDKLVNACTYTVSVVKSVRGSVVIIFEHLETFTVKLKANEVPVDHTNIFCTYGTKLKKSWFGGLSVVMNNTEHYTTIKSVMYN